MKIYLDLVFILNFSYDLLLLMTVDITLKRYMKFKRLLLGALLGALSLGILFISIPNILLFITKVIVSILMLLIAFGYKNIKYMVDNFIYLYMCSIILGGFLYFLSLEFSYKNEGLIFYFDGFSINYIVLLIIAPIILYLYIKEQKKIKSIYNYNFKVNICFKNGKVLECSGFLDTGNKLKDPITKKYVILLSRKKVEPFINIRSPIYVPYKVVGFSGLVECFSIRYIKINNCVLKNYLIGIIPEDIHKLNMDCILNYKIMEDICLEN